MLINSLHLKNILSFKDTKLDLQPLNVLIGANGSGKSNLIDVIALLQAVPNDLAGFLRRNGPTGDWKWKGNDPPAPGSHILEMQADLCDPEQLGMPFRYALRFEASYDGLKVIDETLADSQPDVDSKGPYFIRNQDGSGHAMPSDEANYIYEMTGEAPRTRLTPDTVSSTQSAFNTFRSPLVFPVPSRIAERLSAIKVYRGWEVGRNSPVRHPQRTDGDPNFLEEDFSNLALVVNDLLGRRIEPSLNDYLKRFYESYESLHTRIFGNTVELIVNETGMTGALPASRLSDGTIRFIALLSILCHPNPPPLICIEEPEIAMHPDSQDLVVQLLKQASERTQLIVTTHSPWLIDRMSDEPDAVIVCERDCHPAKGTQFNRLSLDKLDDWLEDYTLGDTWMRGAVGGVR